MSFHIRDVASSSFPSLCHASGTFILYLVTKRQIAEYEKYLWSQVDISGAKKNSAVAGLLRSAMLPLQQVVDGRSTHLQPFNPQPRICPVLDFCVRLYSIIEINQVI